MSEKHESLPSARRGTQGTLTFVAIGLLVTALLGGLKLLFERSSFGHRAEIFAFELLQGRLPYFDPKNPVVVLDTTDITRDRVESRTKLEKIIPALVEQGALAIGVDWEFSPRENEPASPKDWEFFDMCLDEKRKHGVPIFLGVGKRKAAPPKAWLGAEKYKELAAAVGANRSDTTRLPIWTQKKGVAEPLPLLGYALARAYSEKRNRELPKPPPWIRWAVREGKEDSPDYDFVYEDRLVNYSNLEVMRLAAQRDLSDTSVAESGRKSYEGKIVILGDSSEGFSDHFNAPGGSEIGGVLLHASAAYTFAEAPLFEFKQWVRVLLDFALAAVIVVAVAVLRHRHAGEPDFSTHRRQTMFIWGAMACVVVVGWLLVLYTHVMWLDFLMVLAALFLHPKLEGRIDKLRERRERIKRLAAGARATGTVTAGAGGTGDGSAGATAAVCLLAAMLSCASAARAQGAAGQCKERVAAVVVGVRKKEVKGKKGKKQQPATCYFSGIDSKDLSPLSEADNKTRQLEAGQHLSCDKDCVLTIWFCGTRKEFDVKNVKPDTYTVIEAYELVPGNDKYGDPAARPQQTSLVFVPKNPNTSSGTMARSELVADLLGRSAGFWSFERDSSQNESVASAGSVRGAEPGTRPSDVAANKPPARTASSGTQAAASAGGATTSARAGEPATVKLSVASPHYSASFAAARQEPRRLYESALSSANDARDAKDYAAALVLYARAQQILPEDVRAIYGLGNVYADQEQWDEALKSYRRAVELNPRYAPANDALGFALLQPREGVDAPTRLAEAEIVVWRALSLYPWSATSYDLLDEMLGKRGAGGEETERAYRRAVLLTPTFAEAHLRLSELLRKNNKGKDSDEHLRRAAALADSPPMLRRVAEAFEMRGHYKEAESTLRRALALRANDTDSLYVLGRVLLLREHYGEAALQLQQAAVLSPKEFAPRFMLGLTYLGAGRLPEAEQAFGEAATLAVSRRHELLSAARGLSRVGDARVKARHLPEAVRAYEHALRFDPDDGETKQKLEAVREKLRP
jgi:tetratricopeptide (TPR) repeat protein/CHASE2 domain-containing sensor protein